jgi:hydroxymethylbilane synthase
LNQALSEIGGKGLFTKELDVALLDNSVDICVHSMKDVPTWLPDGTILPCNLKREETNDVFICKKYKSVRDLPNGSTIGSASLRRCAQLLAINPTFKVVNFRGNVQTRLKKIENGANSFINLILLIFCNFFSLI